MPPDKGIQSQHRSLGSQIAQEFHPNRLFPWLSAGLINAVIFITVEISFASMIFSGDLSRFLPHGIGLTVFGTMIMCIVVALTSSYPGTLPVVQDGPVAILSLVAVAIVGGMPTSVTDEEIFYTIVVAIALSTFITGALFMAMGYFKLGNLVRFIPYPVVGGFLAGLGWLLVRGGIGVMTDQALNISTVPLLLQPHMLIRWIPGLIFAVLLLVISQRYTHFLALPAMIVMALIIFYSTLLITGTSLTEVSSTGWLVGPFPEGRLWKPFNLNALSKVHWGVVFDQMGSIGTVFIISVICFLLNSSGLEVTIKRDIDLNRELKSTGTANIIASFGGSPAGYIAISGSVLGHKIGSDSRFVGLSMAFFLGMALFFGASALSFFPKALAGAMIVFIGLDFLYSWLYQGWLKLPKADYLLQVLILVVIAIFGFLEGVAVGVILAVMIFILKYSRINVVKYVLSGQNYGSSVERAAPFQWLLDQKGDQIHILKLQGFIFFGTANNLLAQVRRRVVDPNLKSLRFLVLDFRQVTGLDSSAMNSFERMKQLAKLRHFKLVFTHLTPQLRNQFERGGFCQEDDSVYKFLFDLDHGVEWCEDQILAVERADLEGGKKERQREIIFDSTYDAMMKKLEQQEAFEILVQRMEMYLEKQQLEKGHYLIREGDSVHGLYFITFGEVTTHLENVDDKMVRLRTMGMGNIVGELGLYGGQVALASVVTKRPSTVYYLSEEKLKRMEEKDPEIAAELHKFVARHMGDRLATVTNTMKALLEY